MSSNLVDVGHVQLVLDDTEVLVTAGFTSSHLEHLLFWQIMPGLLQGKAQDPRAILDPSLGLVPALTDGLPAETLEQLPQFLANKISYEGWWCQKGGEVRGGARSWGLDRSSLLEQ